MNTKAIVQDVHRLLRAKGRPERREIAKSYFPTSMKVIGVTVPDLRAIVREVRNGLRKTEAADVIRLAQALVAANTMEGRQVAYEILERHQPAMAALTNKQVESLGKGNDNWGSVDTFACTVAGPAWRMGRVKDADVHRWSRSKDRWWRRTALVCTVALNKKSRGGTGDVPRTVDICRRLVNDHDDMVAKAMSWALRELAMRDKASARKFLREHEGRLAARVLREVRNKLETGRKTPKAGGS